jgi:hypothetical protein
MRLHTPSATDLGFSPPSAVSGEALADEMFAFEWNVFAGSIDASAQRALPAAISPSELLADEAVDDRACRDPFLSWMNP